MQKKGDLDLVVFPILGLLIGTVVIVAVINISASLLSSGPEEVIARDLALTLMMVSASPSDLNFRYIPNTEDYDILIKASGDINVKSHDDSADASFIIPETIKMEDGIFNNQISIPMLIKDSEITFGDTDTVIDDAVFCNRIPGTSMDDPDVSFEFDESDQNLRKIYESIRLKSLLGENKDIFNAEKGIGGDMYVKISLQQGDVTKISYKSDQASRDYIYEKIACYLAIDFESMKGDLFSSIESKQVDTVRGIEISIGGKDKYHQLNIESNYALEKSISSAIFSSISRGLT